MADGHRAPLGLSRSSGTSKPSSWFGSSRRTPRAWAANASWTSQTSISSGARPARCQAFGDGEGGGDPHELRVERMGGRGHDAGQRLDAELLGGRAAGRARPRWRRRSAARSSRPSSASCSAGAAARRAARRVVSPRMISSCSNVRAGCLRVAGISTGWISAASRPDRGRPPRAAASAARRRRSPRG